MDLNISSININGFRSNYKHRLIKQFIEQNNIDILLMQETFVDNLRLAKSIEKTLELENKIIWNFGRSDSCGVAILLIKDNIQIEKFHSDFYGRVIHLDFTTDGFENFRIVNAYFPSESAERLEFLNSFSQHITGAKNVIIGGDFNFILDPNLDKLGGNLQKGTIGSKTFKTIVDKFDLTDCFRHINPNKKSVTWTRSNVATGNDKPNYDMIGTRIDRFYISKYMCNSINTFDTIPCVCSDHSFIKMNLTANSGIDIGKSYWKFNDQLLDDINFLNYFEKFWKFISETKEITLKWWDHMKYQIKIFCIDYSKSKNKEQFGEFKKLKKQYSTLDLESTSDLHTFNAIKLRVKEIEDNILRGSMIRSKTQSIQENEKPSAYFFQKEATISKNKTIKTIQHNTNTYNNSKDILTCFRSFYETLYSEEPVDSSLNFLFFDDLPKIDQSDNLFLEKKIEKDEILHALKEMKPNKSPGSDGLTNAFYLKFFHLFGDVLCKIINLAYETGELSETQKLSYITLICKDETRSEEMKCYRPISLLNIDYKIISKIITVRLGKVLPKIIGIDQTCSVKGRSIFDNLHLIRNIVDYVDQKNLAASFICLDQEKAFDRVSRSYMFDALTAFGFNSNFIKWVKLLYNDISSSVIVNNHISQAFPIKRGVRQGCSLSMPLYVICFEPFAHKIRNSDDIKGINMPGTTSQVKLSLFADDSTAFLTTDSSIRKYLHWVKLFGQISGAKINYEKSKGMYLGKWKTRSDHPFGISWIDHHKILGYFFGSGFSNDDIWSKIYVKIDKTLNLWTSRKLSFKGKSTVLNSLCLSKILYYATCNPIPSHYLTLFERRFFRFIWSSTFEPVARKTLYLDFNQGGLNVPCVKLKCHSIYLNHLQKLINNHNANWTFFAKYWIGLQLRKFNPAFASNSVPHSEYIPIFYKTCLSIFDNFTHTNEDIDFNSFHKKHIYKTLLQDICIQPKIEKLCPYIDFKPIWKSISLPYIDPDVRNTFWKLTHDVIYVNYYLYQKHISKIKTCPLCDKIETVSHLFLECNVFLPLNKIVLSMLRKLSQNKVSLSERTFRYFVLPQLSKFKKQVALILLTESRHIIWTNRNLAKHELKNITAFGVVSKFLNKIKFRILIDKDRLTADDFFDTWCSLGFCNIEIISNTITFEPILDIRRYFQQQ